MASKLYGVDATIIIFVFVLYYGENLLCGIFIHLCECLKRWVGRLEDARGIHWRSEGDKYRGGNVVTVCGN